MATASSRSSSEPANIPAPAPGGVPQAASNSRAATPIAMPPWIKLGEVVSLVLALVILLGAVVLLIIFLRGALGQATAIRPPGVTGNRQEDTNKLYEFYNLESFRQQAMMEERTAALRSCGLLVGVAIGFVAVTLFLAAARVELEAWARAASAARPEAAVPARGEGKMGDSAGAPGSRAGTGTGPGWMDGGTSSTGASDSVPTALARLARLIAGLVALICATVIVVVCAPEHKPAQPPGYPYSVAPGSGVYLPPTIQ